MSAKIEEIQRIIGVPVDGIWGPRSQAVFDSIIRPTANPWRAGRASDFAGSKDIERFNHWVQVYQSQGMDLEAATKKAFAKGDNGEGCWGDSTKEGTGPCCALPPEDLERWGGTVKTNWVEARKKRVEVAANGRSTICLVKDRMPHRANITNGAIIDLNPDALKELGLESPCMAAASWRWAGEIG